MSKNFAYHFRPSASLAAPALAQDIKVGTIFPLSGGAGPDGQTVTNAVKLDCRATQRKGRPARPQDHRDLEG